MKKVLYLSNTEVPYRVRFFNELARQCELTVLYERKQARDRNQTWSASERQRYRSVYLEGFKFGSEDTFSLKILKYVTGYDVVIVGCFNSPVQVLAVLAMRRRGIPYYINIDGEIFLGERGLKNRLKRWVLRGAKAYLAAGEHCARTLKPVSGEAPILPYYFTSMSRQELEEHRRRPAPANAGREILIVAQYLECKGLDVALEVARQRPDWQFRFVGTGNRTELFRNELHPERLKNVEVIPFLQKEALEKEYRSCSVFVLPSRQECWGLVINEAASYGVPIVSTWGSGAAVEFLSQDYPQYLAKPGDAKSLEQCLQTFLEAEDPGAYRSFLLEKSSRYSIEASVQAHMESL